MKYIISLILAMSFGAAFATSGVELDAINLTEGNGICYGFKEGVVEDQKRELIKNMRLLVFGSPENIELVEAAEQGVENIMVAANFYIYTEDKQAFEARGVAKDSIFTANCTVCVFRFGTPIIIPGKSDSYPLAETWEATFTMNYVLDYRPFNVKVDNREASLARIYSAMLYSTDKQSYIQTIKLDYNSCTPLPTDLSAGWWEFMPGGSVVRVGNRL